MQEVHDAAQRLDHAGHGLTGTSERLGIAAIEHIRQTAANAVTSGLHQSLDDAGRAVQDGTRPAWAIVATAHPAKFESVVEPLVGQSVAAPAALAAMLERPASAESITADDKSLRTRLRQDGKHSD